METGQHLCMVGPIRKRLFQNYYDLKQVVFGWFAIGVVSRVVVY
jgi:hypothetical protein